jgi:hypothetical protein
MLNLKDLKTIEREQAREFNKEVREAKALPIPANLLTRPERLAKLAAEAQYNLFLRNTRALR